MFYLAEGDARRNPQELANSCKEFVQPEPARLALVYADVAIYLEQRLR